MKTSTAYLPENKRRDLQRIVEIARAEVKGLAMVILYGSYARGTYVDYDTRIEFGRRTWFMSDYDILLVVRKKVDPAFEFATADHIDTLFSRGRDEDFDTPLQAIVMNIGDFNKNIGLGRPFHTDIKREGIMLWDSGEFKLARRRKLNYNDIKTLAQEYVEVNFNRALSFLRSAKHDYDDKEYIIGSFHLHQTCEHLFHTIMLVHTLYTPKLHDLKKLINKAWVLTPEILQAFPRDTKEEKRLFDLLKDAYVQARYNPGFVVTQADLDTLVPRVERLRDIVEKACREKIEYYEKMAVPQSAASER